MKQKIRTASLLLLMVLGTGLVLMACGSKKPCGQPHSRRRSLRPEC